MDPRSSNPCCSRDNRRSFTRLLNTALHVTTEWQTWMGSFILSLSSIICGISYSSLIDFCFRLVFSVSHILWGTFLNYSISSLFFSLFTLWSVYFLDIETSRLIICFFLLCFLAHFPSLCIFPQRYGLNVCVPPNHILKPNAQCDGIKRWGLWEVLRSS